MKRTNWQAVFEILRHEKPRPGACVAVQPRARFAVDHITEWNTGRWCHLVTEDWSPAGLEALHSFAARLGLKREWFQDPPGPRPMPHYDLRPPKRAQAVRLGAAEVDRRELYDWLRRGRESLLRVGSPRWTMEQHERTYGSVGAR